MGATGVGGEVGPYVGNAELLAQKSTPTPVPTKEFGSVSGPDMANVNQQVTRPTIHILASRES